MVKNDARLDPRDPALRIKFEDIRHVLREIEYHRDIAALAGERRASATAQNRRAVLSADCNRSDYVIRIARDYDSNWNLAIVRTVSGVERAAAVVETDFCAKLPPQGGLQGCGIQMGAR
jgi:hypothetical protein